MTKTTKPEIYYYNVLSEKHSQQICWMSITLEAVMPIFTAYEFTTWTRVGLN